MQQATGPAARARGEVAFVDQQDGVSGGAQMLRGARAVDACASDYDVVFLTVEFV
jgi:hypothetical protein